MKKLLILGVGVAGVAWLAKRGASRCGEFDFERWIERMPENAPPKWCYRNITAIRENTERILRLLENEHAPEAAEREHATV